MKKFLTVLFLFSSPILVAEEEAPQTTETEHLYDTTNYEKKLWKEVEKAKEKVGELTAALARRDAIYPAATVAEYKNAVQMLDVKRTLVMNFIGTPSLQSEAIRNTLLSILEQVIITPSDLAQLEAMVQARKAHMNAQ